MYGPTKTARWAIAGYGAVALLVLGGLSWASVASLRLERNTREASAREEQADKLKLAMWRLDGEVSTALVRENLRPYYEYSSYYVPQTLHYADGSDPAVDVLQESPLLDTSALEPWIVLHFQYTDYEGWTSPQLPAPHKWPQIDVAPATAPTSRYRELLLRLPLTDSTKQFAAALDRASHAATGMAGRPSGEDHVQIVSVPSLRRSGDFSQRLKQVARQQETSLPKVLECEPASNIFNVVGQQAQYPEGLSADSDGYKVSVSELTPLWLDLPKSDHPELVLVRRVRAGDILAYQGFIVDWRRLVETLPASAAIHELFQVTRLEPDFVPADTGERAALMTQLPIRLVVSNSQSAAALISHWTSTRITVAFAWITAVVALLAVGLGVRSLVALTSRRTEFTYAVTHELRTPLTTFQLYTDMLASGLVPEEKKPEYLRTLNEESKRLSDLVTEVLEFSRIESNAVRTHLGAYRVAELLDSIKERYASRCAAAGIALSLDANGSAERQLHTDLHIALQILGTLIDNACKYASAPTSRKGTAAAELPRVRVAAYPGGRKLAIEVADNGPGIPPEDRHDLFQPFRRGSQAQKSKVGGVGLGLALAKRWSRLIHGNLELVDQGPRRGTCFRLTLPAE